MSGTRNLAPDPQAEPGSRRGRTFAAARRHSRVVGLLKVAIPLGSVVAIGLVLLVSLFNPFGRIPGLTVGPISFSGTKIAMEAPRLTGFRKDNRPYEVVATTAYQDIRKPNVIELKEMRAKLATDDSGGMAHLVSKGGVFDTGKEHLDLSQDIRIWTTKNEEILLRTASIDLKTGSGMSRDPVTIRTPTLLLDADTMEMADNGKTIAFVGRVRAKLTPSQEPPRSDKAVAKRAAPAPAPATRITQAEAGERP